MKHMPRWPLLLLAALTVIVVVRAVQAATPVTVHLNADGSGYAYGAPADTRVTADANQNIGCVTWTVFGSDPPVAYGCSAQDKNLASKTCWFDPNNPALSAAAYELLPSITSDSYLYFAWDKAGNCSDLQIISLSTYGAKKFFSAFP